MMAAAHIAAILPRGETLRNFVHTGCLEAIASQMALSVISVLPDAETAQDLRSRFGDVTELTTTPDRWPTRFARDILDMSHGRRLGSAAARERWRLRDAEADTMARKLKRLGRKMIAVPLANGPGIAMLERIERGLSKRLRVESKWEMMFRESRPTLVFNASHIHSANAIHVVQAAQWLGIPTAAFVFSWDNLTSQGRCIPEYDYYLVWNDEIRHQLCEVYPHVDASRVLVTGTPQFDLHFRPEGIWSREEFCSVMGLDPGRPVVLYSTGMAGHMPGEPEIVEGIADMLVGREDLGAPQLLVRVYPKDRTGRFEDLRARRSDIVFSATRWIEAHLTPTIADSHLLANTLRHASVGINVASTVSLELAMFDHPVLNIAYNPPRTPVRVPYARYYTFDHYAPLVKAGVVQLANSEPELLAGIEQALKNPDKFSAERRAFIASTFGATLDGQSSQRVADVLMRLAQSEVTDQ